MVRRSVEAARLGVVVLALLVLCLSGYQPTMAQDSPTQGDTPDIVGGQPAAPGAWPWQAALVDAGVADAYQGQFCGGSLIAPNWVLTAAHCVIGLSPYNLDIVLGRYRLTSMGGERIQTAQIILYPYYNEETAAGDLALVRLMQNSTLQPVPIYTWAAQETDLTFVQATITGYGRYLLDSNATSDTLREVVVPIVDRAICNRPEAWKGKVTTGMFCTGYLKGGKGSCQGDSGGPVVTRLPSMAWVQIGLVSWGASRCNGENRYSVHTLVPNYAQWLQTCMATPYTTECTGGDTQEPDNDATNAKELEPNKRGQVHNFHTADDQDWLKFTAIKGATYTITATVYDREGATVLWLYDGRSLAALAYSDDSKPDVASLTWRAMRTDLFYVQVQNYNGNRGTRYLLTLTETRYVYLPLIRR